MTVERPIGTILVVDDDSNVLDMVTQYFAHSGFKVVGAQHAGDGLMLANFERPDVVLLDIKMPGMDGVEALQQLLLHWPELPVIMLSGIAEEDIAQATLRRGAFDYVRKPWDWDHLDRCINTALARQVNRTGSLSAEG